MAINIDVPNLDAFLNHEELTQFSRNLSRLARYAGMKAMAMRNRQKGSITLAQMDEQECERIYNTLPPEWRW